MSLSLFFGIGFPCVFYWGVGVPCPACGLTRAFINAVRLDFGQAFAYHPLFIIVPILPLIASGSTKPKVQNTLWIIAIVLIIAVWVVRMALFFPDTLPMVFNWQSLLGRVLQTVRGG
ncbi:MAG: DUF2752 domain-containing protein [Defluviitaleaceae bacterium]|nr:DUF2752 domain-containing protein [Defluviitaleaceae bacterium]